MIHVTTQPGVRCSSRPLSSREVMQLVDAALASLGARVDADAD